MPERGMVMPDIGYTMDSIDSTIIEIREGWPVSVESGSQEALVLHLLRTKKIKRGCCLGKY